MVLRKALSMIQPFLKRLIQDTMKNKLKKFYLSNKNKLILTAIAMFGFSNSGVGIKAQPEYGVVMPDYGPPIKRIFQLPLTGKIFNDSNNTNFENFQIEFLEDSSIIYKTNTDKEGIFVVYYNKLIDTKSKFSIKVYKKSNLDSNATFITEKEIKANDSSSFNYRDTLKININQITK
jgi:hypothetical protein